MYDQWSQNTPGYSEVLSGIEVKNNPDDPAVDSARVRGGGVYVATLSDLATIPRQLVKPGITVAYVEANQKRYQVEQIPADPLSPLTWVEAKFGSVPYTNATPMPVAVGGYPAGTVFSNVEFAALMTGLLYPYLAPLASLQVSAPVRRLGASNAATLTYAAQARSKPLTSLVVNGADRPLSPPNGTVTVSVPQNQNTVFTMVASDGDTPTQASAGVQWLNDRFWGASSSPTLTNAQVLALNNELSGGRQQTRTLVLNNEYVWLAWPARLGNPASVSVNGFANNAQLITTANVTNAAGFTESYIFLRSPVTQTSPSGLTYVIS